MRRPVGVNSGFVLVLHQKAFFLGPSDHPVAILPSAVVDELLLAASWVFSVQPVLPPDWRPLFVVTMKWARQYTQSPKLGIGNGFDMAQKIAFFGSLLFVGLTAGAAYVVWFDYNPAGMSSTFYAQHMQHAIRVLTIPLPTIVVLGLVFTAMASFQARKEPPCSTCSLWQLHVFSLLA